MNVRRFRALNEKGVPLAVIARECGCDWRTVKKYLAVDADPVPPAAPPRAGTQPRLIAPLVPVVEAWLRADIALKGTVVHERLVAEHGFAGSYQRVKLLLAELRPRLAAELAERDENPLAGLHRRFEIVPGAQAQVDWGDEGDLLAHVGVPHVYSFHMVLSYSRDPFCCFTTSMDLATFFDCHRRAFAHFGGVAGAIVYDRTKTVVRRHVAPGVAVPLHPQAAAFAEHYGFVIDVLAAYRPTGKGRVERQVNIVREHVLAGRTFASLAEIDAAFAAWLPLRRARTHRTHGQVIADAPAWTGPRSDRCPRSRTWSRTGICAGSARTAWSPSRPRSTPFPPRWCAQGSGSRSAPAPTPSRSTRSTSTAAEHSPSIPALVPRARGSWIRRTGTGCRTGVGAPPRSRCRHRPARAPQPSSQTLRPAR